MRALPAAAVLCGALACGGPTTPLYPADSTYDEGHGDLALASMKLLTAEEEAAAPPPAEADPDGEPDPCGAGDDDPGDVGAGSGDVGAGSGDGAFGGATYANHGVPDWRTGERSERSRASTMPSSTNGSTRST
jgi:hypothetical protein